MIAEMEGWQFLPMIGRLASLSGQLEYLDRIYPDHRGDVEQVAKEEFDRKVDELHAKLAAGK